jgi:hypothetical protein
MKITPYPEKIGSIHVFAETVPDVLFNLIVINMVCYRILCRFVRVEFIKYLTPGVCFFQKFQLDLKETLD